MISLVSLSLPAGRRRVSVGQPRQRLPSSSSNLFCSLLFSSVMLYRMAIIEYKRKIFTFSPRRVVSCCFVGSGVLILRAHEWGRSSWPFCGAAGATWRPDLRTPKRKKRATMRRDLLPSVSFNARFGSRLQVL